LLAALWLAGCEAAALTALGVGASAGVSHTLSGITYRTFAEPLPKVKAASLKALQRMQIKVAGTSRIENGEQIKARAADRDIEIELEALSPNTTRMRVVASPGASEGQRHGHRDHHADGALPVRISLNRARWG
jgi:hypothetical protein